MIDHKHLEIEILGHSYKLPFSFSPFLLPFTSSRNLATTKTFRHLCKLSMGIVKRCLHRIFTAFDSLPSTNQSRFWTLSFDWYGLTEDCRILLEVPPSLPYSLFRLSGTSDLRYSDPHEKN